MNGAREVVERSTRSEALASILRETSAFPRNLYEVVEGAGAGEGLFLEGAGLC